MDTELRRLLRYRRRGESGFTLIELLVVIAVLAVLATIVLFNVVGVTNRGKTAACDTDQRTIQAAVDAYVNDHGGQGSLVQAADMTVAPAGGTSDIQLLVDGGYIHATTTGCSKMALSGFNATTGFNVTGTP